MKEKKKYVSMMNRLLFIKWDEEKEDDDDDEDENVLQIILK